MNKLLAIAAVAFLVSSCGSETQPTHQAGARPVDAAPAVKLPPPKYYVLKDGSEYGYEQAVSEDAANKGQIATKLMMVKFVGERDGVIQFYVKDAALVAVFQCERPCEFVKQMTFYEGELQRKEHIRAVEGSVAWANPRAPPRAGLCLCRL